jgi:polyisoprenoid-binding protein YceI
VVRTVRLLALPILVTVSASAAGAERALVLDPVASLVTFTLDSTFHQVRGTMPLAGGRIRFDPETGAASGEVTVDARQARTGNRQRDRKMHREVLETERFPVIIFRPERVEGAVAEAGRSAVKIAGVLSLHGVAHPMNLEASVDTNGGRVSGDFEMLIPYVEWGMKDPSFLLARAAKTVTVKVHAEGRWDGVAAAAP